MRSDEDPDDLLYKKDRYRGRLIFVTPKEGLCNRQYEEIILQSLPPEYDRTRQTHFETNDCSLAEIRQMMSKIYPDNFARSNSDSSRGIARPSVAMQITDRNRSNLNCHYGNKFGHYENDCADVKAVRQQYQRRRKRQH